MKSAARFTFHFCLIAAVVFSLTALSGCKPHKEANFTLQLNMVYGSENFALNQEYLDNSGRRLAFEELKFYLSHITLVKNDNSEIELSDVTLVNAVNTGSFKLSFDNIKGDFKGIKFGVGVDSVQNATDPLSYANSHPLSNSKGMYWSWLKYQFIVMGGKCNLTPGSTGLLNTGLIYHIGSDPLYRTVQLSKSFSACCENNYTLQMNLDLNQVFYGATQTIDIATENVSQTSDHPDVALKFADNFAGSFYLP